MIRFKYLVFTLISFILVTAFVFREIYRIEAHSVTKKIVSENYKLGTPTNPDGIAITLNNYYLMKGGRPWLPVMGEMHYTRYPENVWDDAVRKMKVIGCIGKNLGFQCHCSML